MTPTEMDKLMRAGLAILIGLALILVSLRRRPQREIPIARRNERQ